VLPAKRKDVMYKYSDGEFVKFHLSDEVYGDGVIRGVALNGVPVLGITYIVEYKHLSVPWDYKCITVFESQFLEGVGVQGDKRP
jgi:hypothetical protein